MDHQKTAQKLQIDFIQSLRLLRHSRSMRSATLASNLKISESSWKRLENLGRGAIKPIFQALLILDAEKELNLFLCQINKTPSSETLSRTSDYSLELAKKIKIARQQQNISLYDLSKEIEVKTFFLKKFELLGKCQLGVIFKILVFLGFENAIEEFINGIKKLNEIPKSLLKKRIRLSRPLMLDLKRDQIVSLLKEGHNQFDISKKIGCNYSTLKFWIKRSDIKNEIPNYHYHRQLKLDSHKDEIFSYLRTGLSKSSIAKKVNCSRGTLISWLKTREEKNTGATTPNNLSKN